MPTNYSLEMKCCQETTWTEAHCTENLIGKGCTVRNNTATVIGLKKDTTYYFRVYVVYSNWRSVASVSSEAMIVKSGKTFNPTLRGFYPQSFNVNSHLNDFSITGLD